MLQYLSHLLSSIYFLFTPNYVLLTMMVIFIVGLIVLHVMGSRNRNRFDSKDVNASLTYLLRFRLYAVILSCIPLLFSVYI